MSSSSYHPSTSPARMPASVSRSAPTHQAFPDPPTKETLSSARRLLKNKRASIHTVSAEIAQAERALAELIRDARHRINEMEVERARLVDEERHTLAYLSPLRRLPQELVREIFMWCFEEHPCAAWILSAVCSSWRTLALRMPLLWSKVSRILVQRSSRHAVVAFSLTSLFVPSPLIMRSDPADVMLITNLLFESFNTDVLIRFALSRHRRLQQISFVFGWRDRVTLPPWTLRSSFELRHQTHKTRIEHPRGRLAHPCQALQA